MQNNGGNSNNLSHFRARPSVSSSLLQQASSLAGTRGKTYEDQAFKQALKFETYIPPTVIVNTVGYILSRVGGLIPGPMPPAPAGSISYYDIEMNSTYYDIEGGSTYYEVVTT